MPEANHATRHASRRTGRSAAWAAVLVLGLAGCQMGLPSIPSPFDNAAPTSQPASAAADRPRDAAKQGGDTDAPSFTQFSDIPIPANSEVDLDNLLVLGSEDGWIGRLTLKTSHGMTDMYSFYEREMPRFGWDRITIVRSAISTMTYSRGPRIATITLQPRTTGGANVDFTVAPGAGLRTLERSGNRVQPIAPPRQVGTNG